MRKFILTILILAIALGSVITPIGVKRAHATADQDDSALKSALTNCGVGTSASDGANFQGCLLQYIAYPLLVSVPSFLLGISAKFFDYVGMLSLDRATYEKAFISNIWKTVRDISNIFFILILLYAAMELILGIGHDPRRTVAQVVIIALLINFSLFFCKVVIDTSNIMALVFYNSIDVQNVSPSTVSTKGEKEIAGTLVASFNINRFFEGKTIEQAKSFVYQDQLITNNDKQLSFFRALALMTVYAMVILPLAYAFIVAGLAFFGRALMLMVLMIVAPFAFISYAVPALRKIKTVGFDSWMHTLLETSFVAAIFMFIIYVTAEIVRNQPFSDLDKNRGIIALLISIFLPAVLIVILILKGAKYAKEASGEFTGAVIKGAGMLAGGVLGGAAILGTGTLGAGAKALSGSKYGEKLRDYQDKNKGFTGWAARTALKGTDYTQKASFDLRKAPGVGSVAGSMGMNMNAVPKFLQAKEGGFKAKVEEKAKALKKESELYKTTLSDDQARKQYGMSAEQLNHHRLSEFNKRLGIDGLLGSLMYSAVSGGSYLSGKELNDEQKVAWAKNAKGIVGALAAAGIGAGIGTAISGSIGPVISGALKAGVASMPSGGGVIAGAVGGAAKLGALGAAAASSATGGMIAGATVGSGYAGGYKLTNDAVYAKFGKDLEKEEKKMHEIDAKIDKAKKTIESEKEFLGKIEKGEIKVNTINPDGTKSEIPGGEMVSGGKVDTEKVEELLRDIDFQETRVKGEMQALAAKIASQDGKYMGSDERRQTELQTQYTEISRSKSTLTKIKESPDRTEKAEETMEKYKEKKDKIHKEHEAHDEHKEEKSGGGGHEARAAAPHKEEHKTSGGGGGHSGH